MLFTYHFPVILGTSYGFRGRDKVGTKFSDRNVVPGSAKYVDQETEV